MRAIKNHYINRIVLGLILTAACVMAACTPLQRNISDIEQSRLARPAFMGERTIMIDTAPQRLWERMHRKGAPVTLYLGGADNLGLKLATRDLSDNVIWASSIDRAGLEQIRGVYDINGIHAVIVNEATEEMFTLLSSEYDILSVRFVAADLTHFYDRAGEISEIPQLHMIGGMAPAVPPSVFHGFRQAMGTSECVTYMILPDANHKDGWAGLWPKLLKSTPRCKQEQDNAPRSGGIVPDLQRPAAAKSYDKP